MNDITEQNILSATELLEQIGDIIPISDWRGNKIAAAMKLAKALAAARAEGQKNIQALKIDLELSNKVMLRAEYLIGDENLHDKWHKENKPHGAFHDLLFRRLHNEETLRALIDKVPG